MWENIVSFSKKQISMSMMFILMIACVISSGFANILDNDSEYMQILNDVRGSIIESFIEEGGGEFLKRNYKQMPFLRNEDSAEWNRFKIQLKQKIDQYADGLVSISYEDSERWNAEISSFVEMLPYIKPEIGEDRYKKILDLAHYRLGEAGDKCSSDKHDCEEFLQLLSQEKSLYLKGEERKYIYEVYAGYRDGVRGVISTFAFAKRGYKDYVSIMSMSLDTYLTLKAYGDVEDIIMLNDRAEVDITNEDFMPIPPFDLVWIPAYPKLINEIMMGDSVLSVYPEIPYLPSRKGVYRKGNGKLGNIWWDLGKMLKEEGSEEAQNLLVKLIANSKGKEELSRVTPSIGSSVYEGFKPVVISSKKNNITGKMEEKVLLYGIKILRISALANFDKSRLSPNTEKAALIIVNTRFADLSDDEEYEIDTTLVEEFPNIKDKLTEGAVVDQARFKIKSKKRFWDLFFTCL